MFEVFTDREIALQKDRPAQERSVGARQDQRKRDANAALHQPAIGLDGKVYVVDDAGSDSSSLYALDSNLNSVWARALTTRGGTDEGILSSPAIGADGTIYVGSYDKTLYALDRHGRKKWEFPTGDYVISSPVIAADGTIYIGSYDHKLYAVNPDGTKRWEFKTQGAIVATPALAADETLYAGSDDRNLYALNAETGEARWIFFAGNVIHSSPVIAKDGTVYIGAGRRIMAVEGSAGLARSPWPMYRQNAQHTGRAPGVDHLAPRLSNVESNRD
jgi:outer membrane protein assembly factor BamB